MQKPIYQHYIPKSYLKFFAVDKGKRYLVDTLMRGRGEKIKTLATTNICAEKNIYTFSDENGDPYALEKFYANEVDAIYPKVYNVLVNSGATLISKDTKREILNTILSLKFRRPAPLESDLRALEFEFSKLAELDLPSDEIIGYEFQGLAYSITYGQLSEELGIRTQAAKEDWLIQHFADWQAYVDFKMDCGLEVIEVPEDIPIITSDNPVSVLTLEEKLVTEDLLNPNHMLEVPLDRTHYLIIHPNATSEKNYQRIHRSTRDKYFAAGVNLKTEQNSTRRIISYPGDLRIHEESQFELNKFSVDNLMLVENQKNKAEQMAELFAVIVSNGNKIFTQNVADKVKEMRKNGLMENDPNFQKIVLELAKKGFMTV